MFSKSSNCIVFKIVIIFVLLHAMGRTSFEKEADGIFRYYLRIAKMDEKNLPKHLQGKIDWEENITENEKKILISFFESDQNELKLYFGSKVIKADLDRDGWNEFILNSILKNPTESNYGDILCVIAMTDKGLSILFKSDPFRGILTDRKFDIVDFDKDGFKDIVDYSEVEAYGEEPSIDAIIYKNNDMNNFTPVYDKFVHSYLQFVDVDMDGHIELLEPVLGVKRKVLIAPPPKLWINIYEWDGKAFVDRSEHYLDFYRAKKIEYKELLEKYTKETDIISKDMVGIYEEYLKRIEELTSRNK